MFIKEIFNSSCWHGKNGKSFSLIELNILNWRRNGHLWIRCRNKSVKILKKFFTCNFKWQICTDNFKWMIFSPCIPLFLLWCKFSTCMKLTFLGSLFYFFLIDIFRSLILFIFIFLFFLSFLDICSVLLLIDNALFRLLWSALVCN